MEYKDLNAIGIVRLMLTDGVITEGQAAKYFPELAEVKDEDIKRWVINEIKIKHHALDEENVDFVDKAIAWLEKQGKQNSVWSKLDEELLKLSLENLTELKDRYGKGYGRVGDCIVWLKSLKDRVGSEADCTTTKETSEEDEKFLSDIIKDLVRPWNEEIPNRIEGEIEWLKNKIRTLKSRWKWIPSKEQMEGFEHFVRSIGESGYASPYDNNTKLLYSLLADLKKLREE